jgi:hypothetical protein
MFDIPTLLTAMWFAIIALILAQIFALIPYPRIRILLPLVSGILLGLVIFILNPGLESGYRGQMNYLGPFCFPLLVPLIISVPLTFFRRGNRTIKGKTTEFFGACVSAFLFLILYQSRIFFGTFQEVIVPFVLLGSTLAISSCIFFIIGRPAVLFGSREESEIRFNQPLEKKKAQTDPKLIVFLIIYLLASLSPLFFIDFVNNHDRSTMGQLTLYLTDPSIAPNGSVIHLTEENFQEYPELGSLLKTPPRMWQGSAIRIDNAMKTVMDLGTDRVSCNREFDMRKDGLIDSGYVPAVYLEFEGKLYVAKILHYAGEDCVRVSLFS